VFDDDLGGLRSVQAIEHFMSANDRVRIVAPSLQR
jgi:hypothetical protein